MKNPAILLFLTVIGIFLSASAVADSGGAANLNISITNTSYTLDFGSFASVVLQDSTTPNTVLWSSDGGPDMSGVAWNGGAVSVSLGSGNPVVTSFSVSNGTVIDSNFINSNYNSVNGSPYGQWSGGTNVITTANGVCSLGYAYSTYGCLAGHVNVFGTNGIYGTSTANLLYGLSFADGSKTAYGWFSIGITPGVGGINPNTGISYNAAGSSGMTQDPVYNLTLNGYGYSTDGTVYAGLVPVASVPEPVTYVMLLSGLGLLGFMVSRRKKEQV